MKENFNKTFTSLLEDKSLHWSDIANELNNSGFKTTRGLPWNSNNAGVYARKKHPSLAKRGIRTTAKGFYCSKTKRRQCVACKRIKDFKKFYWTKSSSGYYPRSECKICKNDINKNLANEKRIDKNPDAYWQCDCFWVNPNRRKNCYKCGKNIDFSTF